MHIYYPFIFQNEKVEALRIPVNQDKAPVEACFDHLIALLKSTSASTPIVFNCQVILESMEREAPFAYHEARPTSLTIF